MPTSAFRSSSRRPTDPPDSGSSTRRSRSLSRAPKEDPLPPPSASRGRFVNTERGSGFPEISLDDLANEFFPVGDWEAKMEREGSGGRLGRRASMGFAMETESSRSRGRSVSRGGSGGGGETLGRRRSVSRSGVGFGGGGVRRRRSVSVASRGVCDQEMNVDLSHNSGSQSNKDGNFLSDKYRQPSSLKSTSNHVLSRTSSQRDVQHLNDTCSSQSSSLTEDEARVVRTTKNAAEKTIRTVYAEKSSHPTLEGEVGGLYHAMRKEVRHAVEEIRLELEEVIAKKIPSSLTEDDDFQGGASDVVKAIDDIKRNYASKLEESQKRKEKLLAELAAEEYRGQELTKVIRELIPDPKQKHERPARGRRRSNEKTKISMGLMEEAEKYLEDFLSNVEDTDISSFDGERSDTSSTLGGSIKREPLMHSVWEEVPGQVAEPVPVLGNNDGVVLPWLQWETNDEVAPLSNNKRSLPLASGNNLHDAMQEAGHSSRSTGYLSPCSHGSWSANSNGGAPILGDKQGGAFGIAKSYSNNSPLSKGRSYSFDKTKYSNQQLDEDLIFEMHKQRQRIEFGGLILCRRNYFGSFIL